MTVTLDIDEKIVERARELAKYRGTTPEVILAEYVRTASRKVSRKLVSLFR